MSKSSRYQRGTNKKLLSYDSDEWWMVCWEIFSEECEEDKKER